MNVPYSTPPQFISIIEAIASAYSLDLEAERSYLRLKKEVEQKNLPSPLILVIEKLDHNTVKVAHYCQDEQHPSKAIAFLSELRDGEKHWTPLEIIQGSQSRQVASINKNASITQFDSLGTRLASELCEVWVEELEQQQWHLNGNPIPRITVTSVIFLP